jgi:hypothetical protein
VKAGMTVVGGVHRFPHIVTPAVGGGPGKWR